MLSKLLNLIILFILAFSIEFLTTIFPTAELTIKIQNIINIRVFSIILCFSLIIIYFLIDYKSTQKQIQNQMLAKENTIKVLTEKFEKQIADLKNNITFLNNKLTFQKSVEKNGCLQKKMIDDADNNVINLNVKPSQSNFLQTNDNKKDLPNRELPF